MLEQMDVLNNKLFDICKKRIGIQRPIFNKVVNSGKMSEWSVSSCLELAALHDTKVIVEGDSADEETVLGKSVIGDALADSDDESPMPIFGKQVADE